MVRYIQKDEIIDLENMKNRVLDSTEERIDEYRKHSDIIVLYTIDRYKDIDELERDYEEYLWQSEDSKTISDIVSIDMTGKSNTERYLNYKMQLQKNTKQFDPLNESEEKKVKSAKSATQDYWGISDTQLMRYMKNYSNVIAGMFVRLESLVELLYFDYHKIDVVQNACAPINKDNAMKIVFSNYHDKASEKEREYFKDKIIGIVCFDGTIGYVYSQITQKFYEFRKDSRPPIDHTKGMLYGQMLRKEARKRKLPNANTQELLAGDNVQESFYEYATNGNLYTEQRVLSYMMDKYPDSPITNVLKTDVFDREKDGSKISVDRDVPYFTPQQMYDLGISYHSKTPLYSPTPDCISINEKDIKKWYEEYKLKLEGYFGDDFTPSYEWRDTLNRLYRDIDRLDGQALLNRKQSILDLGWNPEIPFSNEARKFARKKISNYVNTIYKSKVMNYEDCNLCIKSSKVFNESVEDSTGTMSIVFYNPCRHGYKDCAVSFNESETLFSFDGRRVYDRDQKRKIYTCCLPQSMINKVFRALQTAPKETNMSATTPYYIYDTRRVAEDKFRCMLRLASAKPVSLIMASLSSNPRVVSEGVTLNDTLPISEVKEFPVDFDKDGNMLIKKGKKLDYEAEYAATHLAMKQYHKAKNVEGMEYCMCKLWYLNLMISDEIHHTKNKEKLKKLHKARAKIVNDIHTYMPYILELDPDFNIEEAYEESPFSDHTVKINKTVIDMALAALKGLIKLLV